MKKRSRNLKEFPRFTDLRAMVEEVGDQPGYARLRTAVRQAATAQSCVSDLAEAETCLNALDELRDQIGSEARMTRTATEAALLRTAVTLYERATAAGAKRDERGSIQIRERLTDAQRRDHDAIVRLRQRSLAHVYVGEVLDGDIWHQDHLFLIDQGGPWKASHASKRIQWHACTFQRLKRQIPIAIALVQESFHAKLGKMHQILEAHPLPLSLFEKHVFDPVERFGSERKVQAILDGQKYGRSSFSD